jgi:hypothetical protein
MQIKYTKPDGTTSSLWTALLGGDNESVYYDALVADLDTEGDWEIQPYIEMTGFTGHADKAKLPVFPVISVP